MQNYVNDDIIRTIKNYNIFLVVKEKLLFRKEQQGMGLSFRKRIKLGNGTYLNLSKSGASISKKVGRTTINSRGNVTVNLGNGMSYRTSVKKKKK